MKARWPTPWIAHGKRIVSPEKRLFCLPCAGGSASSYRDWAREFPDTVEVCPIQLPGREGHASSPLMTDLLEIVEALGESLEPFLDVPFALFGHSLGGLIAFELARDLRKHGYPCEHLFVAGTPAPHLPRTRPPVHQLPEDDLLAYLQSLGGTPKEVLEKDWLVRMHLPILRADMTCLETYVYGRDALLSHPITTFGGLQDTQVAARSLEAWEKETHQHVSSEWFDGGHFFVQPEARKIIDTLLKKLNW